MRINREHKDRLFKFIFQEKENLLQLYNALNNTTYTESEGLEIVTLEDVIYMRMKNDISFILDYQLNLFEHQSTDNPNMPLRGLLYFARQYEKYVNINEYNLYGSKVLSIPTPQYVVFYNGNSWSGERKILKLSDSFANNNIKGCIELEVLQLNINYGHNKEIMEKCRVLGEYAAFIGKVKRYQKNMTIEEAVDRAVNECIEEGILKEILTGHRAEVKNMILTEYDEEKTMRLFQKEYEEEAAEKIAQAQEEAAEKIVQAQEEAAEKITQAQEEVAKAQAEADRRVAEIQKKSDEEIRQMRMEIESLKEELKQAISRL
jgi:hypothetical protein